MKRLQDDLLEIYNAITVFSKDTIETKRPLPISVNFDVRNKSLVLEQSGKTVYLQKASYWCSSLSELKETYLLPYDYRVLMDELLGVIEGGELLDDRLCVSPEYYGMDIYKCNSNSKEKGPILVSSLRFASGNSWIFKKLTKLKFGL